MCIAIACLYMTVAILAQGTARHPCGLPALRPTAPPAPAQDARGDQCDSCGNLLNPTELIRPKCALTGTTPVVRKTRHMFLDLPQLQPKLQEYITRTSQAGGWSSNCVQVGTCCLLCEAGFGLKHCASSCSGLTNDVASASRWAARQLWPGVGCVCPVQCSVWMHRAWDVSAQTALPPASSLSVLCTQWPAVAASLTGTSPRGGLCAWHGACQPLLLGRLSQQSLEVPCQTPVCRLRVQALQGPC